MKRRWLTVLGCLIVAGWTAVFLAFGSFQSPDPLFLVGTVPFLLAGVLFVLAGTTESLGGIEWYQLSGLGDVLIGLSMSAQFLWTATRSGSVPGDVLVVDAIMAVGGLSLVFIGIDWIRGGKHFDLSTYESGPIFDG
ncbi:hypothetical protein [Halostella sp. PRR32]|uniref:hypothetical protein n=1 Tax=Halostella sp. PRR32 TaxID=3098147 RepID=UPI002B1CE966|nr:hypothetical protein [Halostella sp. PRR32]